MKSDKDKSKGGCCSFILVLFYLLQPYFYLKFYEKPFLIPQLCAQEWENNIKTTWRTSPGEPGINTLKKIKARSSTKAYHKLSITKNQWLYIPKYRAEEGILLKRKSWKNKTPYCVVLCWSWDNVQPLPWKLLMLRHLWHTQVALSYQSCLTEFLEAGCSFHLVSQSCTQLLQWWHWTACSFQALVLSSHPLPLLLPTEGYVSAAAFELSK